MVFAGPSGRSVELREIALLFGLRSLHMTRIAEWMPMAVTILAWAIFFRAVRGFKGERFLQFQQEHTRLLKHHTTLLERIALALEKEKGDMH